VLIPGRINSRRNCAKHGGSGRPRLRARSPPEVRAGWSVRLPLARSHRRALVSSGYSCASILPPPPITSLPTWRCRSLALFHPNRPESRSPRPRSPTGRRPRPSSRRRPTFGPLAYLRRAEFGRRCAGDGDAGWLAALPLCCWCVCFLGVMAAVPPGNRLLRCSCSASSRLGGAFCARVCSPFAVCLFSGAADFSITWSSAFLRRAAAASQKGQTLVNFFSVIDARLDYVVGPISLFADARGRLKVTYMAC